MHHTLADPLHEVLKPHLAPVRGIASRLPRALGLLIAFAAAWPSFAGEEHAYQDHFYNLEYDQAIDAVRKHAARFPSEPRWYNELVQMLLYRELYRSGTLDSELVTGDNPLLRRPQLDPPVAVREEMEVALARAISLSEQRLKRDPGNADALYELGVSYASRANIHFFIRKNWHSGLQDAIHARRLHERCAQLDRAMVDARLTVGAHDYLIANLPAVYRVMASMVSLGGSRERGIRCIEQVAREGDRNRVTARMLLAVIYRREKQPEKGLRLLDDLIRSYPRNHLFRLEYAQLLADAGQFPQALAALESVERLRRDRSPGYAAVPLEKIRLVRGNVYMRSGQIDEAVGEFEWVASAASSSSDEMKAQAWLRLGQIRDLQGDRASALLAYREAVKAKPESEAARQAGTLARSGSQRKAPQSTGASLPE